MGRRLRAGVCGPSGKWRNIVIRCDNDWMKRTWVRGIVIGNRILFADPADKVPSWLLRHELEHIYQQTREGIFKFYLKYFWYSLRYGYKKNPFELEAYARQNDPLTQNEEQLLWKLREDSPKSQVA